jgi:hypothetical protein
MTVSLGLWVLVLAMGGNVCMEYLHVPGALWHNLGQFVRGALLHDRWRFLFFVVCKGCRAGISFYQCRTVSIWQLDVIWAIEFNSIVHLGRNAEVSAIWANVCGAFAHAWCKRRD